MPILASKIGVPRPLAAIALTIAALACHSLTAAPFETFTSKRYGYTVEYPHGWYLDATLDNLEIENFPPAKAARGVRLPSDGAAITLLRAKAVHRPEKETLGAWIESDSSRNEVKSRRMLDLAVGNKKLLVEEIRGKCCAAIPPFKEYVSWYFRLSGSPFRATLEYWAGDPNAAALLETLRGVVLSLRSLP